MSEYLDNLESEDEANVNYDELFRAQAMFAMMDLGLPEDEAEMLLEDYLYE